MNRKILAFLLSISLLLTMLPTGALAEELEVPVESIEAPVESIEAEVTELLAEEEIDEPAETEEVADDLIEAPIEAPEYIEEAEPFEIDNAVSIDDEAESFMPGYARIVEPLNAVYDDASALIAENLPIDSIVYMVSAGENGLLQVAFGARGQVVLGWIDPVVVSELDADAVDALKAEAAEHPSDVAYFGDDSALPLPMLELAEEGEEAEPVFKLNPEKAQLTTGETLALSYENADRVTWTSEDEEIATVSEDGIVTAIGPGQAAITATDDEGHVAICDVHVAMLAKPGVLPDKVKFNVSSLKIGVGEESTALEVILGSDPDVDYIRDLTFSSNKTKYVTVDEDGVLVGVKKGSATITVTTSNGKKATCKVTVKSAPTKVKISQKSLKLNAGETGKLTAKLNSSSAAGAITWSSDDEDVAVVDPETGVVTAVDSGIAEITATTYNDKTDTVKVTVRAEPTDLSFEETELTLGAKQKVTMEAKLNPGAECDITYKSSNAKVVKIKGTTFTAVAAGEATITASTYNGLTATCHITVEAAPKSVKLPFKTLNIGVGDTFQLEPEVDGCATGLTYKVGSSRYLTVSKDGMVSAEKVGTTYVTIKTYNGKSFKLKVIVQKAPTSIEFSPSEVEIGVGETTELRLKASAGSSASATLKSSKPSVVKVDSDTGEVTGLKVGSATITAVSYNGLKATCKVSVYPAPTAIEFDETEIEMAVGDTYETAVELTGGRSRVTYESDNTKVATVSSTGVITGKAAGKAIIRANTTVPGVYAETEVSVWGAPSSLKLRYSKIGIEVEETYQIETIIPDNTRTTFKYKSSNSKVVSVDEDGWVEGVGLGTATITVTTHNGKTAKLTVIVSDPYYPTSLKLDGSVPVLDVGDGYQIDYILSPDSAITDIIWSSSNERVATVDDDGYVIAEGKGSATITAVATKNSKCKLTVKIQVGKSSGGGGSSGGGSDYDYSDLVTEIPDRITDEYDIEENLEKIEAIRESALSDIDRMEDEDIISSSDAKKRRSIVNNIFDCYAFPWMTQKKQKYWKAANSEGGVKDFKPGNVYYGLPYISGSGNNRHYNVTKALSEKRYYDSGEGYYILNQNKLLNGKYVGNDCSGLVDVAIWGTGSSHSDDRTKDIASNSAYRTIKDFKAMRTGDLICKGGSHVVMFLYYVNDAKTQFMMIENGGEEAGTNTVHCDIYPTSYYSSRSYKVRRLASLG